ncbi:UDP-glucose 4-epimerase family protein [Pseudomonas asplenii]|uniref:Nucleoside-diphosphate-sugar epimerase n=1 Tax=Pseudomonas asplenii TaxID=53407 RepID=A0A1H6P1Y8_9PSED|nr:SDR family oxidoreductase [Pseudomonas fuscovaginae]SEI23465.1 Nucleoside-diphosphate-sugar epimerase [Pseudomonas fuscovaginae]
MTIPRKILVTGATGFVGSALVNELLRSNENIVVALVRRADVKLPKDVLVSEVSGAELDCSAVKLSEVNAIVHCAARVHVMNDASNDPLREFRKVNVKFTLDLASRAAEQGVKRFIYISSIKVNGEETAPGCIYRADDPPAPIDSYGISKMEAEEGLRALGKKTGMEIVIIRPVLVYGPGVKANFRSMMKVLKSGVPLPLGLIKNKRSLVSLDNLVDLIITCIDHPAASNQTFLASDGDDVSTPRLLTLMGQALGRPPRLVPVPTFFLEAVASLLGKKETLRRLVGSLQVDISKANELLGWRPVLSLEDGLKKTADNFISGRK